MQIMTKSQSSRPAVQQTLTRGALRCVMLFLLSALVLIATPVATASASAAPAVPRGGDPLALLAVQQAELTAPDGAANDLFGDSVALSGDTALVGAPGKTAGGHAEAGAVYVFTRLGKSWSQQAELTAPDGAASDYFGWSVALSGDTALVGAVGTTVSGQYGAGAVYVFTRSGMSWSEQAELTAADSDSFGSAVALDGNTALVGAAGSAAAYVFTRSATSWSQQAELTAANAAAEVDFGLSVALSGDTALVGAYRKTVSAQFKVGAAYVFTRSGTSWSQQAKLTVAAGVAVHEYGLSVALFGDTALVGAYGLTISGPSDVGAAYVFTRSGTKWSKQAKLTAANAAAGDAFGSSVALSVDTALVGAAGKTVSGHKGAGDAYVFTRTGTSWSERAELTAADAAAGDNFGDSLALSAGTVLLGAAGGDYLAPTYHGAAYVDVLSSAPSVSLEASRHSVKVGEKITLSGIVRHYLSSSLSVPIERQLKSRLVRLKSLTCSTSGAFSWKWKATKTGKWVLVAIYKVGTDSFSSRPLTVTVHR